MHRLTRSGTWLLWITTVRTASLHAVGQLHPRATHLPPGAVRRRAERATRRAVADLYQDLCRAERRECRLKLLPSSSTWQTTAARRNDLRLASTTHDHT